MHGFKLRRRLVRNISAHRKWRAHCVVRRTAFPAGSGAVLGAKVAHRARSADAVVRHVALRNSKFRRGAHGAVGADAIMFRCRRQFFVNGPGLYRTRRRVRQAHSVRGDTRGGGFILEGIVAGSDYKWCADAVRRRRRCMRFVQPAVQHADGSHWIALRWCLDAVAISGKECVRWARGVDARRSCCRCGG